MSNKKFYWLKLKDNFFQQKEIKKLRKIAGGDTYTIIYLKMLLLSMGNDGIIEFEGIEDSLSSEIALEIDECEENVKMTIAYLVSQGLIVEVEQGASLTKIGEMTGSESSSAERVRKFRQAEKTKNENFRLAEKVKIENFRQAEKTEKNTNSEELLTSKTLHCNKNVTTEIRDKRIRDNIYISKDIYCQKFDFLWSFYKRGNKSKSWDKFNKLTEVDQARLIDIAQGLMEVREVRYRPHLERLIANQDTWESIEAEIKDFRMKPKPSAGQCHKVVKNTVINVVDANREKKWLSDETIALNKAREKTGSLF